ncbi:36851_t:CDS:2 [Gigaspora margarita]|uniref:36851_t:CDS:1 n=1 Tax=Gigaspora margarita TaxID=4874 RepID=A0ABN7V6R0_GIGMA|nr:36851_t:CDS:2 [Gigaspora margarita]
MIDRQTDRITNWIFSYDNEYPLSNTEIVGLALVGNAFITWRTNEIERGLYLEIL